jgi:hypothetical protein
LDVGHGIGRAICVASLLYGNLFEKIVGVEIIPELNRASINIIKKLLDLYRTKPELYSSHSTDIELLEGDFTTGELFDWTIAGIKNFE